MHDKNSLATAQQQLMNPKFLDQVRKELAERSLSEFIKAMWRYIDPADYIHGWHLDAISDHLVALANGQIRNLLITMPPRHMKSISVSVAFSAWLWIRFPELQFLYASYAQTLSVRDNVKCRRLMESPLYRRWWGDRFALTGDQNTKIRFENNKGGYRLATSVDGALTGEGGDIIVIDDPHNIRQAESPVQRQAVLDWFDEAMSTRLNNPKTGRRIIVQQRVHENDLAGHVMEQGGWVHLNLPARYEADYPCTTSIWSDPRTKEGELMWPERFGEEEIVNLETILGPYGTSSQLQQRPTPREGGLFMADRIEIIQNASSMVRQDKFKRGWDKAGTVLAGAYSAGVKMGVTDDGKFVITDIERGQWASDVRERRIKQTAGGDGVQCAVIIEQEPGSGGKESAENTVRNLAGYYVIVDRPTGNKEVRAYPLSSQVNMGNVILQAGPWNKAFLDELRMFPNGKYKDQVDAAAMVFNYLVNTKIAGGW